MSTEALSQVFDALIDIKEFCIGYSDCESCPFYKSPLCKEQRPCDWIINNPNKSMFKFF